MRVALGFMLLSLLLPAAPSARSNDYLWQCVAINREDARYRCYARLLLERVERSGDPARELPRLDRETREMGGEVAGSCHALMHEVGRRYGRAHHVTLSSLRRYVPRSNDPTCSAGFGMGLAMYLGPQLRSSRNALAPCLSLATRFREYTCIHGVGHALLRGWHGQMRPAIETCRKLPRYGQDCAQGVFHDYWISLRGADGTTKRTTGLMSPRYVCDGRYGYVRPCWYRYFIEQPLGPSIGSAKDIRRACGDLPTLQHQGCVMGASLAASTNPFEQMRICARLGVDGPSCLHGVSVPAVSREPRQQGELIRRCELFGRHERLGCYAWLGRALAVVTNGRFDCVQLRQAARKACVAGSRRTDEPLVAFA